ncbi:UNVERIFIED_CONTAM: hypothetical protein NCL1_40408 [Trichonephila clavipes]
MWEEILRTYLMRPGRICGNNIRHGKNTIIENGERLTSKSMIGCWYKLILLVLRGGGWSERLCLSLKGHTECWKFRIKIEMCIRDSQISTLISLAELNDLSRREVIIENPNLHTTLTEKRPFSSRGNHSLQISTLRLLAEQKRPLSRREVLEVRNNNLTIWKKGRRVTVNFDQVRVYHPRHSDKNSFDGTNETLYEGKGSGNGSNRSHPGKSRSSRKHSGDESKSRKSNKGTTGLEDQRLKRKNVGSNGTVERNDRKRSKMCRKRSFQGFEHREHKRQTPILPKGIKRTVPSSVASRTHKYRRNNLNPSQGPESFASPSHQQKIRQLSPPKEEGRRGARVQSDKA